MSQTVWEPELPPGYNIWDHQITAVENVFHRFGQGDRATLCLMPTGAGKTVFASLAMQRGQYEHDWKTLFIAQRRKLVTQAANTFRKFGFVTAIEMAEHAHSTHRDLFGEPEVVVGTVQTLKNQRLMEIPKDYFQLIICDEAHHSLGDPYEHILTWFEGYKFLGLTATPKGSPRNLGERFQSIAYRLKILPAIESAILCPIVTRTIQSQVDLRNLHRHKGDFCDTELGARILPAIEGLAHNIKLHVALRPTVVFTPDLATASAMASMLRSAGCTAKYVAGSQGKFGMPEAERTAILDEFDQRKFQIIVSCDLLTEGWDAPFCSCVAICRPTFKAWRYVQMVGRGFRICEGKENLLVLDFDWQAEQESKELCGPYSLIDESLTEGTRRELQERTRTGGLINLLDTVKTIEQECPRVAEIKVKFTGKYAQKWAAMDSDPIGVGKIIACKIRKTKEMRPSYGDGMATDAQVAALQQLGVNNAWSMSKWGASKLISRLRKDQQRGIASWQQRRELLTLGVPEPQARIMNAKDAAALLCQTAQSSSETQHQFDFGD